MRICKNIIINLLFFTSLNLIAAEPCVGVAETYSVVNKNPLNRVKALKLHNEIMSSPIQTPQPMAWDGNVDSCIAGNLTQSFRELSTRWLNYLRFLGGLRQVVYNCRAGELAQEASLMMLANNSLNHNPPPSWKCYTEDGKQGAMMSNLASAGNVSLAPARPINMWFNSTLHRFWLLLPALYNYGLGVSGNNSAWAAAAKVTYTEDPNNPPPSVNVVSWPPPGLYVYEDILSVGNSYPKYAYEHLVYKATGINLATADARFEINGENIPLEVSHPNQYLSFKLNNEAASAAFNRIFSENYAARVRVTLINYDPNNPGNITATRSYDMVWISRAGALVAPIGEVVNKQTNPTDWVKITRQTKFKRPVILLQSKTYNHQSPFALIARRSPNISVTVRKSNPNDIDIKEDVQVVLLKPGEHKLEGGLHVKAEHVVVPPNGLTVSYQAFSANRPMLFAQIVDKNIQGAYSAQAIYQPGTNTYNVSIVGLAGAPLPNTNIDVDIVMVEKNAATLKSSQFTAKLLQDDLNTIPTQVNVQSDFTYPFLLGSVYSKNGNVPVMLRITNMNQTSASVKLERTSGQGAISSEDADFLVVSSEIARTLLYPTVPVTPSNVE